MKLGDYFNYRTNVQKSQSLQARIAAMSKLSPNAFYISRASMIDRRMSFLPVDRYAGLAGIPREAE